MKTSIKILATAVAMATLVGCGGGGGGGANVKMNTGMGEMETTTGGNTNSGNSGTSPGEGTQTPTNPNPVNPPADPNPMDPPPVDPVDTADWSDWTMGSLMGGTTTTTRGDWSDWTGVAPNTEQMVTQTRTRTVTTTTTAVTRIDTRTCDITENGDADSPAPTCNGEASRVVTVTEASSSTRMEMDSRTIANPDYVDPADTAAWSGWTMGTPMGGVETVTNGDWTAWVTGTASRTEATVTQTRTRTVTTATTAVTRTDTRTCEVTENGDADSPAPTCSGSNSRIVTVSEASSVTTTENDSRTIANPAYNPYDTAAWSDWTMGTVTGGVVSIEYGDWSSWSDAGIRSRDVFRVTTASSRTDTRTCVVTVNGLEDTPAPECSGANSRVETTDASRVMTGTEYQNATDSDSGTFVANFDLTLGTADTTLGATHISSVLTGVSTARNQMVTQRTNAASVVGVLRAGSYTHAVVNQANADFLSITLEQLTALDTDGDGNVTVLELDTTIAQLDTSITAITPWANLTTATVYTNLNIPGLATVHSEGWTGLGVDIAVFDGQFDTPDGHGFNVDALVLGVAPGADIDQLDVANGITWSQLTAPDILTTSVGADEFVTTYGRDLINGDTNTVYTIAAQHSNYSDSQRPSNSPPARNLAGCTANSAGRFEVSNCNTWAADGIHADHIIYVGEIDTNGNIPAWSNIAGETFKDHFIVTSSNALINAPGVNGNSYAAPRVAGVAALIMHKYPNLSATNVAAVLLHTADDLGAPGVDAVYGHGRLNAGAALAPVGSLR